MTEFRPPQVRSRARLILALVLLPVGFLPILVVGPLLWGKSAITYTIADGTLTVFSGGLFDRERSVRLKRIRSGRSAELSGGRRTWGTAIPGYCVGRFTYPDLGPVWQATDCGRRGVLLHLRDGGRPWVISPPDALDFLARLSAGEPTRIELPPARSGRYGWVMAPLLVLVMLVIIGVEALVFLGPGRMRYLVGNGAIEVRTLFSRRRWGATGMRARHHRPRVTLRVAGSAMPGYYTGYFRADGKTTRVYATNLKDGVLLEGPARVYLSPADPAAFLAALRSEGATVEVPS